MAKSKEKQKKQPSKDVKTGSLGMGDAYAYAIGSLVDDMKSQQGSNQDSWLGVPKQTVDLESCCDKTQLKVKPKQK